MTQLSAEVKHAYEKQYDASIVAWRDMVGRFKAQQIIDLLQKNGSKPNRILEVGCGEGSILKYLGQSNIAESLYGLEISDPARQIALTKGIEGLIDIQLFDGYSIPYADQSFDLVVCSHVLEHVEHPRILLREIRRVSKMQYFEVPIDFSLRVDRKLSHYLAYGHINVFTPALFRFLVKSEKFAVLQDKAIFWDDRILKQMYPQRAKFWRKKLKNGLIHAVPVLRDFKPDAYGVLCERTSGHLSIF